MERRRGREGEGERLKRNTESLQRRDGQGLKERTEGEARGEAERGRKFKTESVKDKETKEAAKSGGSRRWRRRKSWDLEWGLLKGRRRGQDRAWEASGALHPHPTPHSSAQVPQLLPRLKS